jgi:hypothetical protein
LKTEENQEYLSQDMGFLNTLNKDSVRTSKETKPVSITTISCLMPFTEMIVIYCENSTKHTNALCAQNAELLTVKVGDRPSHNYH